MEDVGYTQREFAEMVGVSEAALSRYLSDAREPKMEIIANMATALNTTTDYLLRGENDKESFEETYRLVARGMSTMTDDDTTNLWTVFARVLVDREKKECKFLDYKTPDGVRMENPIKPTSFA